jgi:putative membrane protein
MSGLFSTLVVLHVIANVIWIGSILAVAVVLGAHSGDAATRGKIGVDVYQKLATPAFVVSFVAGVTRLALDTQYYFVQTKFMHGKLPLALVVIGLHHVIGGRAKKMAKDAATDSGNTAILAVILLLSAAGAVFLVVTKPF